MGKIGVILLFIFSLKTLCLAVSYQESGQIVFLIHQGHPEQALKLYQERFEFYKAHDFELIHRIGLALLDQGFRQSDSEAQLLALFGASISAHSDAYYILEESLKISQPQIQLVALRALARLQNDRADQALQRTLGSDYLLIRLEAAHQMCLKKHPLAVSQTESLMYKTPRALWFCFPQLFAMSSNPYATRLLRKLLNHPNQNVRLEAILSIAKHKRDDLLPQLRKILTQINFAQQEACIVALGLLKDEKSAQKLQQLTSSQYFLVTLAAWQALYRLGRQEAASKIEEAASLENLFAIYMLGEVEGSEPLLVNLLDHPSIQVRLNASLALLEKQDSRCFSGLKDIFIRDKRDLAFIPVESPGRSLKAWKAVSSSSQVLKDEASTYHKCLQFKEAVLTQARHLPEKTFLDLAQLIFNNRQNELIPHLISLLEEVQSEQMIALLKIYQQKVGAPLIRHYCNVALYRMKEEGPFGDCLKQWVKSSHDQDLIRFRPLITENLNLLNVNYQLTPEETSALLIETFEAFAANQDEQGIQVLLEAIQNGNKKNRYALAGLLLRAVE